MGSIYEKLFLQPVEEDGPIHLSESAVFTVVAQDCYRDEAGSEQLVGERREASITAEQRGEMLDALHTHVVDIGNQRLDRMRSVETEGGEKGKSLWVRMPFKVHRTGPGWVPASHGLREEKSDRVAEGTFEFVTTSHSLKAMGLEVFQRAITSGEKKDAGRRIITFLSQSSPDKMARYLNGSDRRAVVLPDGSGSIRIGCLLPRQLEKDPTSRLEVDVALIMTYTRGLIHVLEDILDVQLEFQTAVQGAIR